MKTKYTRNASTPEELKREFLQDVQLIGTFYGKVEQSVIRERPELSVLAIFNAKNEFFLRHCNRLQRDYQHNLKILLRRQKTRGLRAAPTA